MEKIQKNKHSSIGLILIGLALTLKNLLALPELFIGLGVGAGLAFEIIGLINNRRGHNCVKEAKLAFLRKVTGRSTP
ncbi:MAG: hypothetical protein GX115_02605 [Ruminiclostridium sp.]|nr:hypothetical protein [Ruminiclostridium sp.]